MQPTTKRGRETRGRIVASAAALMHRDGVHPTSVEDVLVTAGAGKGQFYYYFPSKEALVGEVLRHQIDAVLTLQSHFELESLDGLAGWFDAIVAAQEEGGVYIGCPLGSIVAEVARGSDDLQAIAASAFDRWEAAFEHGFAAMRDRGELRPDADPPTLAEAAVAAIQGGYLLAAARRDVSPLRSSLAAALALACSFAAV